MTTKQKDTACEIMMEYEDKYCPKPQTVNMSYGKVILKHDLIRPGEQRLQICGLNKSCETKGCNEFHAGALNAANRTGLPQSLDRQIQLGGSG